MKAEERSVVGIREQLDNLAEKLGTDSDTAVTAHNRDSDEGGQRAVSQNLRNKCRSTNDIQRRNTEEPKVGMKDIRKLCMIRHYLLGSKTPCFLKTSATIGTVEFTGFEMTSTYAFGAVVAMPVARSRTIPALI